MKKIIVLMTILKITHYLETTIIKKLYFFKNIIITILLINYKYFLFKWMNGKILIWNKKILQKIFQIWIFCMKKCKKQFLKFDYLIYQINKMKIYKLEKIKCGF